MSENVKLGQILRDEAHRDAVHVTIVPVVAAQELRPGSHIILRESDGKDCFADEGRGVGIVYPFLLTKRIRPGDRFYLCSC